MTDKKTFLSSPRQLALVSLVLVIPLGFFCKYYRGWAEDWINNNVAAIWYEVFWCLLIFWYIPQKTAIFLITISVFGITSFLEFLQLWHPPFLEWIRSFWMGRLLLGTTFSRWDFLYYAVGCLLSWWWLRQIWQFHQLEKK